VLEHGSRERDRLGISIGGRLRDRRPAREVEAKQHRHLVEGFAHGVVAGLAEDLGPVATDPVERRVPTRNHQAEIRRLEVRPSKLGGKQVTDEVVDPDHGDPELVGERLPERQADEQGANQARARGDRDAVEIAERHSRLCEGLIELETART